MTRLSDLLRGAADRAPIGEVSVSAARALRRVRVHRGVRGAANGLAGAGAAALIVVGIIHPSVDSTNAAYNRNLLNAPAAAQPTDDQAGNLTAGREMMPIYDSGWGTCGSYPLNSYPSGPGTAITLSIGSDGWTDLEGASTLEVPVTRLATDAANVQTTGPDAAILYQGMLVGLLSNTDAEQILNLAAGDSADSTLEVPLVNCFDGSALPAGSYEIVVSQGFADVADEPVPEPSVSPIPEPTLVPEPAPEPSVGVGTGTAEPGSVGDSAAGSTASVVAPMPVEPPATWDYRVTSTPVAFTIAGDVVDNPFGGYVNTWVQPALPDNVLTPGEARDLYYQNIALEPWDMAPGTSRWIIPNYNNPTPAGAETLIATQQVGWFGCSYDGLTGLTFPTESANLDLLQVSVDVPSRVHLSYGWVVDGNPKVTYSVTNSSDYLLPGFYGEPNHQLYLVRDGRVIAEAYPVNTDPNNPVLYMNSVRGSATSEVIAPDVAEYYGILEPGASTSGDYLWRDVSGCWNGSEQGTVPAGTYTVLSLQSLYLQSDVPMPMPMDTTIGKPEASSGSSGASGVVAPGVATPDPGTTDVIVDPSYPTYDWLELQMWTSLGTVTITTS